MDRVLSETRKPRMLLLGMCNEVPNAMPCSGKNHKQQAANEPNPNRNNVQNLLNFTTRLWVEAAHHILIPHSHCNKHQH